MASTETGGSLSHSQSSPSGMDCVSPSREPRRAGRMMSAQIHFLDDSVNLFQIQYKTLGHVLFEQVCRMLNLLEVDYFGLQYVDTAGTKYWLDYEKPMCRQMGLSMVNPSLYFCVKFYTPDPAQLEEEYTRYLFTLQTKRDLAQGILQCNDNTAALMASYIVQAECGDYASEDYPDHTYLSSFKFVPHQDAEFECKIMENHKKHIGQSPAEADLNLLETARRCELYGIRMTAAKDHEGVPLNLAAAHMGVLVFQNLTKINTFSWAKIRKLSFKRKRFLIKLHPEGYGYYKDTVEFFFEGRNECKNFWKKCIENHAFFRCAEVRRVSRQKARLFSRGSSFRYSGRTQKQMVEYVRENYVKRQSFQRSTSLRVPGTSRRTLGTVGTSISAQPLLPVSNSQSCGSVVLTREENASPAPSPKLTSASQPSSPRPSQEPTRVIANGSVCTEGRELSDRRDLPPGLDSPEFDHNGMALYSPDYLTNDTDDISHDSYQLEDKENTLCTTTTTSGDYGDSISLNCSFQNQMNDEGSEFKAPLVNDQHEIACNTEREIHLNGIGKQDENMQMHADKNKSEETAENGSNDDITYVLYRRHLDSVQQFPLPETIMKNRPRVRVETDHILPGHNSPTLYVRASKYGSITGKHRNKSSAKHHSQTVDFVAVHQLPSTKSFSSQDDSIEERPLEKEIFNYIRRKDLHWRHKKWKPQTSSNTKQQYSFTQQNTKEIPIISKQQVSSYCEISEINKSIELANSMLVCSPLASSDFCTEIDRSVLYKQPAPQRTQSSLDNLHHTEEELSIAEMESLCLEMEGNQIKYYISSGKEIFGYNVFIRDEVKNSRETYCDYQKENGSPEDKQIENNERIGTGFINDCYSDSSSASDAQCSHISTSSSEEMHKLSDAQLFDTHVSEDEFDATDNDSTQPSHLDEVYSETSHDVAVQTQDQNAFSPYRTIYPSDSDDAAQADGDAEYDDSSIHEGMDLLEDITERTESLSEEETAPVGDGPVYHRKQGHDLQRFVLRRRHYNRDKKFSTGEYQSSSSSSSVSPSYDDST